jgi:hypothetical protein
VLLNLRAFAHQAAFRQPSIRSLALNPAIPADGETATS